MQAQAPRYNSHALQSSPHSAHQNEHLHLPSHAHTQAQAQAHVDPADSDDGGQQSADDLDNDDDHHEVTRLGKRKRPISVS